MAERYNFYVRDNRKVTFNLTEPIMQEDSGVTDFVFHIPKIINDLEVSDWAWWFVFVNAKKEKYSIALTLSDDPERPLEYNLATYTVDYAMSIKAGSVQFAFEAINAGTGGAIDNEWHTESYGIKVKETLQGNQVEYVETESDIISALLIEVQNKVNQLVGGATPLPVASVSAMTDTTKVYLNTTDKNWYYYNRSAWVSGGLYGAGVVDSVPTQGSTNAVSSGGVYSALAEVGNELENLSNVGISKYLTGFTEGEYTNGYINGKGELYNSGNTNWKTTDYIPVSEGNSINYSLIGYVGSDVTTVWLITAYDSTKTKIADKSVVSESNSAKTGIYTVSSGTAYLRICGNKHSQGFTSENIIVGYENTKEYVDSGLSQKVNKSVFDNTIEDLTDKLGETIAYELEIGNIFIGNNWSYSTSSTRVRLKQGKTLNLTKGTLIELTESGYRYYIGWKTSDNVYGFKGWLTNNFVCPADGEYVFLITAVPEVTIEDVADYEGLLAVYSSALIANQIPVKMADMGKSLDLWDKLCALAFNGSTGKFVNGGLTRLALPCITTLTEKTILYTMSDLYQVGIQTRNVDGSLIADSGWLDGGVSLPLNTPFTLALRRKDNKNIARNDMYNWALSRSDFGNKMLIQAHKNMLKSDVQNGFITGVAHRGFSEIAPENTIPAFKSAYDNGFEWAECDIRMTSDGEYIILHDDTINRTARNSDGTSLSETVNIADITYAQVLTYDFGIWKSADYADTKIPTLEELLRLSKRIGLKIYIELKLNFTETQLDDIMRIVSKCGMSDNVVYMGQFTQALAYISNTYHHAQVAYLPASAPSASALDNALKAITTTANHVRASLDASWINTDIINTLSENNADVSLWTVDGVVTALNLPDCTSHVITNRLYNLSTLYRLVADGTMANIVI